MNKQRRTSLFSATLQEDDQDSIPLLARAGLRDPVKIIVREQFQQAGKKSAKDNMPALLNSYYMKVSDVSRKFDILIKFLSEHKKEKLLVFFTTCAQVDYFGRAINSVAGQWTSVFSTHGRAAKSKREQIFTDFNDLAETQSGILICTDVMARGVDFPNIHWVVQFDIPQNAENFVHRCGRTARADRGGSSLVLLMHNELEYLRFLKINQNIKTLQGYKMVGAPEHTGTKTLERLCKRDRRMIELGTRAFVSFVQAYSKHEQNVIIKTSDLDFGKLANGYVLFQMPRMPELKEKEEQGFQSRFGKMILEEIPYKDKSIRKDRERKAKERAEEKKKQIESGEFVGGYMPRKAKQWTKSKDKETLRRKRRDERKFKKDLKRQKLIVPDE